MSNEINRRDAVCVLAATGAAAVTALKPRTVRGKNMSDPIDAYIRKKTVLPKAGPWPVLDPFLFCVFHNDAYPQGNGQMGPKASLAGRRIGQDFSGRDGWSMYHGDRVPGFPRHPHRGFETVTIVRQGLVDHADSLGAAARYGEGDVQWLTAGDGINHAEMFPLLKRDADNTLNLFQIWLNLPRKNKRVKPHFSMFWDQKIPKIRSVDAQGRSTHVTLVAGQLQGQKALKPPPNSWAAVEGSDVAILIVKMQSGASWQLPEAPAAAERAVYVNGPGGITIAGHTITAGHQLVLQNGVSVPVTAGEKDVELLLLQGRPIGEPVARHGPFVMNTREEIVQAFADYRRTQFGGWPWPDAAPVHGEAFERFARHADGRVDKPI